MSEKRKFEDLLDPDYPQNAKFVKIDTKRTHELSREERISKIRAIVCHEFQKELTVKEQEILEIDDRIQLGRKLLSRVRYAVVSNYYCKKGMELPDPKALECVESLNLKSTAPSANERDQRAVHPALKSILGKKEIDFDEILKARPTREAAKTAKTSIKEKLRTKKEQKHLQRMLNGELNVVISHDTPPKLPRRVEPNKVDVEIPQINIARSGNQTKHIIAVGNTSKYVGDEKIANSITHKWLVYVKTKTGIPIENLVKKVRFFLHPSYRPHDIVDVLEPPFQIAERGWGEFQIRLQLFFEPSLRQKPVQLMHHLVLDKTLSGLQTMGAETLVEIWLRTDHLPISNQLNKGNTTTDPGPNTDDENSQISEDNTIDHIDDKLMEFLTRIENQTSKSLCEEDERIEPTINVPTGEIIEMNSNLHLEKDSRFPSTNLHSNESDRMLINIGTDVGSERIYNQEKDLTQMTNVCSNDTSFQSGSFELDPRNSSVVQQNSVVAKINSLVDDVSNSQRSSMPETEQCSKEIQPNSIKIATSAPASTIFLKKIEPNKPIHSTLPNSTLTNPQILQKRIFKCFDKKGNVKYVQMLVKSPLRNGQDKIVQADSIQNAVVISKTNGQLKESHAKPVIFKISPKHPVILGEPTASQTSATIVNGPPKSILSKQQVIITPTSVSSQISPISKTPGTKENQSILPTTKFALNGTNNKNQVMVKNGKMYIIDPLQAKLKQQTKKQESLLKPQVSLLKPIVKNDNLNNCIRNDPRSVFNHTSIATDHDYTNLIGKSPGTNVVTFQKSQLNSHRLLNNLKSSIVTVNSPNNSRINVIVTKLDDDEDDEEEDHGKDMVSDSRLHNEKGIKLNAKGLSSSKYKPHMHKPRKDYKNELELLFRAAKLNNVRQAVDFLLKRLPLINNKAADISYNVSFPFVVESQAIFDQLMTPKLKANEWLRAKYIQRLLKKHSLLETSKIWTTKEIIIFARLYAYTPVIKYRIGKEFSTNKKEMDSTLKDLVKKEIKREKYDMQTISLVHGTYDWINQIRIKIKEKLKTNEDIIDVDGSDNENKLTAMNEKSPEKQISGKCFIPLDSNRDAETSFVNDACQQIGIRLKPEEIVSDIVFPASHLVLTQCLRSFIDDLLRRAAACRPDIDNESPLVETAIQPDDIRNAILARPQWDFLTNDGLGVARPKDQKQ